MAGAAGVGNALGSVIGNRKRTPPPERMATAIALLALSAAVATSILYSVWALVLLVTRRAGRRDSFSFGPAMVLGAALAFLVA